MRERPSILLASANANLLRDRLTVEGYQVLGAQNGYEALNAGRSAHIDCLIFDLAVPGKHGFDVCRELRASGSDIAIVLLTRQSRPTDGVIGLRLGADDYVRTPVVIEDLLARVEAIMRRYSRASPRSADVFSSRDLYVNFRTAEVKRDEEHIALTALEMHLLQYLIEHRGEVVSREELLDKVWGYGTSPVTRTVDVRIASLRRKLGNSELIVTVHGFGYKFAG